MNNLIIIGNVTKNPALRATQSGLQVCSFTVAVNRYKKDETDFFRVTAWDKLADICSKYLVKGSKVCVQGPVSGNSYENNGKTYYSLEVNAQNVEFLSPKTDPVDVAVDKQSGMVVVDEDDLPF